MTVRLETPPAQWPIIQPLSNRQRDLPPAVSWSVSGKSVMAGRLNRSASAIVVAIATAGNYERVGILVREGVGKDRGKFALEFIDWGGRNDTSVALQPISHTTATRFAASALVKHKRSGSSLLEREGDYLIGWFNGHEPNRKKS